MFAYSISAPRCKVANFRPAWYKNCIETRLNATACHRYILDNFDDLQDNRVIQVEKESDFGTVGVPFLKCKGRPERQFDYMTDLMVQQAYWSGGSLSLEIQSSRCLAMPLLRNSDMKWGLFKVEAVDQDADTCVGMDSSGSFASAVSFIYGLVSIVMIAQGIFTALARSKAAPACDESSTPVYTIGTLGVAGTGCPPRSVEAVAAQDGSSVSIHFSSFEAATDKNHTRVRLACSIAVPLYAQPGQSIGFFKVDFRGYVYVPDLQNASAKLSNDYFFAGGKGLKIRRTYQRGVEEDIMESNTINFQSVIWSPCGGSTNFRINTSIMASKAAAADDDVQLVLKSMDSSVQGSVQVAVASRKCDPRTGLPI